MSEEERAALYYIQTEASVARSALRSNGRGGLPPSLVLHVLRRDEYRCKACGRTGDEQNGGLTVHHKGGAKNLVSDEFRERAERLGRNHPSQLTAICHQCHNRVHDLDRAVGKDEDA